MNVTNANRVSHFWVSQNTPFGSEGTKLWEPIFTIEYLSLKSVYNSCKLKRILQVAKFLIMYSFTHTNIDFVFRYLATEIVTLINVYYQMKCFSADSFSFLGAGFSNIPTTFLTSCEVQTRISKTLKYPEQYIRDHISGTKVRIGICSEYDAVFNFSFIALCNLTKSFTFSFILFLS